MRLNLSKSLIILFLFISFNAFSQVTGSIWKINNQASWLDYMLESNNLEITEDGLAQPTTNASSYSFKSKINSFSNKVNAKEIVFKQSDVWDNWNAISKVEPSGAGDAPILVSVKDGEYYLLALGNTNGYHAWQSNDMLNWVDKGPVTPPGNTTGRWATSAEYKNGLFYIYYDSNNDEKPHLIIDDDLSDGVIGDIKGVAYDDPTNGSDCSVFRDNADGLFHIIYEDWSPLNARQHAWDSPLAGHVSSANGLTGFEAYEHPPVIDHRTTPTGEIKTYDHPQLGILSYEEHLPEQDSYGDYTTIKVGSQYYIFSDYDPVGQNMRTARFTSDSWDKEFELVGTTGSGHPDPTTGFAEGQFYLVTQQTDYVSPGPWVDGVTARAGVDVDGNGTIDTWTNWQTVKEAYDHNPNYIRVVDKTDAKIDLSSLPAGYGFQFEFSVDNNVVSGVSPLMDIVEMEFTSDVIENVAFQKSTTQSTTDYDGDPSRAVDGNTNGKFNNNSVTHTQRVGSDTPWWRVDLGGNYEISSIQVFNRKDGNLGSRLNGAKLYVGNTNSSNPTDYIEVSSLTSGVQQNYSNLSISGRYVMIYHEGSSEILSLAEVQVYGTRDNIAFQKSTTQSTTGFSGVSSRAVDGNTNGVYTNNSITHTQGGGSNEPWWKVDLGSNYIISAINVFNRIDGSLGDRLNGAKVLVGNIDSSNPDDYTEISTLNSDDQHTLQDLSISGRYVMIYHHGSDEILSLAEVQVYGENSQSFIPDPNKTYFLDVPKHNLRLAATGESEDAYANSTNNVGVNVQWKFVDKGNGYWHLQRAAGGSKPRLRSDGTKDADMQTSNNVGVDIYFRFDYGNTSGTHYITLPDGSTDYKRLQMSPAGEILFTTTAFDGDWVSWKITEAANATFHYNCNYNGSSISLGEGEYPNIGNEGLANDQLSSLRVPDGFQVTLYQDLNFEGASITFTADDACLINNSFNDVCSSVKIEAIGAGTRAFSSELLLSPAFGQNTNLQWYLSQNEDRIVDHFILKHSSRELEEMTTFETIQATDNLGVESYYSMHENPVAGNNFYQVITQYKDGSADYSMYGSILFDAVSRPISIAPNPTADNLKVDLSNYMNQSVYYNINSIQGREVMNGNYDSKHNDIVEIDLDNVPNGIYIIYLEPKGMRGTAIKFVVAKNY